MQKINVVFTPLFFKDAKLPCYATAGAVGMDLQADTAAAKEIRPGQMRRIYTGLTLELPEGVQAEVRTRSGMAAKQGLIVLNSPGTVDPDYRGEIIVMLYNTSQITQFVNPGMRVAQLVFTPYIKVSLNNVPFGELSKTARGAGGFGSTGV